MAEVRAPDRPGLLHGLGRALAALGVDVRSAHVATHAGQAVDTLYLAEPDGSALSPGRVGAALGALLGACEAPSEPVVLGRSLGLPGVRIPVRPARRRP